MDCAAEGVAVQVERAKQEIRERLDPKILAFLEKRAAQRRAEHAAAAETPGGTQVTACKLIGNC